VSPTGDVAVKSVLHENISGMILQNGEEIILAVRPSIWFVFLRSLPGMMFMVVILASLWIFDRFGGSVSGSTVTVLVIVGLACTAMQIIRAAVRWRGRFYVLTNLRLLTFHGGFRQEVYECVLQRVTDVVVVYYGIERAFGLGSLAFTIEASPYARPGWIHIRGVDRILEEVGRAVARARGTGNGQ